MNVKHAIFFQQVNKKTIGGKGGNNNVMKANKTYTQNEKNFTNNLNFLLKNKKNKR